MKFKIFLILLSFTFVPFAFSQTSKKACTQYINKFCSRQRDKAGVLRCLKKHSSQLSAACRKKISKVSSRAEKAPAEQDAPPPESSFAPEQENPPQQSEAPTEQPPAHEESTTTSSHSHKKYDWGFGVIGGINMMVPSVSTTGVTVSSDMGFGGGLTIDYRMWDFLFLQADLLYDIYASKITAPVASTTKITYFNFPILLKAKWENSSGFNPYALVGGLIGMKMSTSGTYTGTYKSLNMAMDFGAGVEYMMSSEPWSFFFDFRYEMGLVNVSNDAGVTAKLSGMQFLGGARYHF